MRRRLDRRLERRVLRLAAATLVLAGSSLALEPVGAADGATSLDATGWWWRLQTNPALLAPPPPTVAEGQLLVQGAPDGATAIAAIAATLAPGQANPVLTLEVVAGGDAGGADAVVLACQAGSPWTAGAAKPWSEKPQPACEAGGVAGVPTADASAWTFDLAAMQFSDKVNVVLVPGTVDGQPAGANGSTFSLTFAAPTALSIQTADGEPPLPPVPALDESTFGGVDLDTSTSTDTYAAPDLGTGGGSLSLPPISAALPEGEQGLTPVAPSVQDRTPLLPASAVDPRPHARVVGVLLLLLGGAAVYLTGRQQLQIGPEGVPGGLGRWARPRWGAPPALRG